MFRRCTHVLFLGLVMLTGCLYPVTAKIDSTVCDLAAQPRDLQPMSHVTVDLPAPTEQEPTKEAKKGEGVEQPRPPSRLRVPDELLPGGHVPPIRLPVPTEENKAARRQAIEKLYPPLAPLSDEPPLPPGPMGVPLTLSDLQKLAQTNSPQIRQAVARVEEARGRAIQAGLAPNPIVGYESDTSGTTGGAGYVGGFIEQTIKTGNKLQLARAVAVMDLRNAQVALKKARADLTTEVRRHYFAVLVAQESVRLNRALVRFTTDVYQHQADLVKRGGFAAPYEPMYLRAQATQARANLVAARNRRTAAWKQLAATLGLPGMCPTQLAGRIDVPIPAYCYKDVLAKVLSSNTEVQRAENMLIQSQYQLELERMTPIPDVNLRVMLQKDRTSPPFQASPSVAVSVPVPVWDKNQGNILQAQAGLVRAKEEAHRVRTELTSTLAEAFERYENSRVILGYYRDQILPDLVRFYRGVYERYQREPAGGVGSPPGFTEVVVAQQNLASAVGNYITTLGQMWQAVVDVADPLQTPDLFGVQGPTHDVAAIPELGKLPPLPCCHPCSPLHDMHQRMPDGCWPAADTPGTPAEPKEKLPAPKEEKKEKQPDEPKPVSLLPPLRQLGEWKAARGAAGRRSGESESPASRAERTR